MLEHEAWDEVAERLSEDDFYKPAHRKIFAAMGKLNKNQQPIDLITLANELTSNDELNLIGGTTYLTDLLEQTPSAANITTYAQIIHEKSLLRKVIAMHNELSTKGLPRGL